MKQTILMVVAALLSLTVVAQLVAGDDPIFVRWMVADDPYDQTILDYWARAQQGNLSQEELVDLGTMLFHRGYPKDAVRIFRQVTKDSPKSYEAWFRIGLVEHRDGRLRTAEQAYERCLKLLTGHGWCNFYMGLLQEQTGHAKKALDYYRRAFKFAPELADPEFNPEVLYSKLQLGALLQRNERKRFTADLPMRYLEPERVAEVTQQFEPEPPPPLADEPAVETTTAAGEREEKVIEVKVGPDRPRTGGRTAGASGSATTARPSSSRRSVRPTSPRPTPKPDLPPAGARGTGVLPPAVGSVSPEASIRSPSQRPTGTA